MGMLSLSNAGPEADIYTIFVSRDLINTTRQRSWGKVITSRKRSLGQGNIFTPVCHSVHRGACMVAGGVCMVARGACVVALGGMRGCSGEACVVLFGGMRGFIQGGMRGFIRGGMHGFFSFSDTMRYDQ